MKHPTKRECYEILKEYETPAHIIGHCEEVATTAYTIGKALNEHGHSFDLELVLSAGLLHDVVRLRDKHWEEGAKVMRSMGYEEEAEIINAHMTYSPFSDIDKATEVDLVCLGDRTVIEDRFVGVEDRINYIVDKATRHGHPEAKTEIVKYKLDTERFVAQIEERIGVTLQELMKGVTIEDI